MLFLIPTGFFILGAIAASFSGVMAVRLNTGQSFFTGRSRCDACSATLSPAALIPVFSFFISRGRARCCGTRLSWVSPVSEALLGLLFVGAYYRLGISLGLVGMVLSLIFLLALVLYDFAHQILPPGLLALFISMSALTCLLISGSMLTFFEMLLVAVAVATFHAMIHFFSGGRAMGLADAPLVFGLALLTGGTAVSGFVFSFWIGAVVGIVVLFKRQSGSRMGIEVPFAPFLAAGFLLAYFTQWNPFALITTLLR